MLCYPVREVMLWQRVGNPDCLVSHQVASLSAAADAVVTCHYLRRKSQTEIRADENMTEEGICFYTCHKWLTSAVRDVVYVLIVAFM